METLIGYAGVAIFLIITVVVMERGRVRTSDFSDYATAGRSFGPFFGAMAYINTFLPGTVFISFAGLAASAGLLGFYLVAYGMLGVLIMLALSRPVYTWGKQFDLRTQSDLLGLRYNSRAVRVVSAVIGIIATIPWIILGMQSLALVFEYLSFGAVSAFAAVIISVVVIVIRQYWTVKHGMRGIMLSDMVQGIVAYFLGTLIAVGLLVWLLTNGHGFGDVPEGFTRLPGVGSELGPLYALAITLTGALGTWCWPDIFVRLFTARSAATIRKTALIAAPIMLVFGTAVLLVAYLASSLPEVAAAPDRVWFIVANVGGVLVVTLAGICVVAATMGNVGANIQAIGTQAANDVVGAYASERVTSSRAGKIAVAVMTLVSAVGAFFTASTVSGLVNLAMLSYQGIVQLAPTLLLGIFWKRGTAAGAVTGMVSGFAAAAVFQVLYPVSIPWLGGLTSGIAALGINVTLYVAVSLIWPNSRAERGRIDELWASYRSPASAVPAPVPAGSARAAE